MWQNFENCRMLRYRGALLASNSIAWGHIAKLLRLTTLHDIVNRYVHFKQNRRSFVAGDVFSSYTWHEITQRCQTLCVFRNWDTFWSLTLVNSAFPQHQSRSTFAICQCPIAQTGQRWRSASTDACIPAPCLHRLATKAFRPHQASFDIQTSWLNKHRSGYLK